MKFLFENLFRNKAVKLIAVLIILYFGLYQNKEHPDSLGRRFSRDNVKKDFKEVKDKSHFIVDNIRKSKEVSGKKDIEERKEAKSENKKDIGEEKESKSENKKDDKINKK